MAKTYWVRTDDFWVNINSKQEELPNFIKVLKLSEVKELFGKKFTKTYDIKVNELKGILNQTAFIDDGDRVWGMDTDCGDADTILLDIKSRIMNIIDRDRENLIKELKKRLEL